MELLSQTQEVQDKFIGLAEDIDLTDLYFCTRAWSAWGYGTMTSNDFAPAGEDEDFIFQLAEILFKASLVNQK